MISSYWPRPGKVHNAFFEVDQIGAFTEMGHDVDVVLHTDPWRLAARFITTADLGLDAERARVHQIVIPRIPEPVARHRVAALANLWSTGLRLRTWLTRHERRKGPFDAVIVHGERNIGLSAGIWNPQRSRRAVMIVHGADPVLEKVPEAFLRSHISHVANAGLQRIVLVGNRLRSYAQHMGYDDQRVLVIPNGFRHPTVPAERKLKAQASVRLVTAARLVPVKGIDDALHALSKLRAIHTELDWSFDVLGDGPERGALEALTSRLGLKARVTFHGAVSHEQVLSTLNESDIFVLPSWNEAFGLAYLEAMAMGVVVVGCFENGAADILSDGVDGCLIPPRDVESLTSVLAGLIGDPIRRSALAREALKSVKRFSWASNARAVLEALKHA